MIGGLSMLTKLTPGSVGETPFAGATKPASPDFGASFAEALGAAAGNTVNALQNADRVSIAALSGKDVSTRDVADAVMSAEQSLQTSIAIRDKIVSAYLEISRMQI